MAFTNFPDETQGSDIVKMIDNVFKDVKEDIEEVYSFGRTGKGGAARFSNQEAMWSFMTKNKGNHKYEYQSYSGYLT